MNWGATLFALLLAVAVAAFGFRRPASLVNTSTPVPLEEAAAMSSGKLYPALYLCHGAGPMPVLGDRDHIPMVQKWKEHVADIVKRYGAPQAIAVVSAHYQTSEPEVGGCMYPEMYYDYGGFPSESYRLQYPAPGNPNLAAEMVAALNKSGLAATVNAKRRYDHGVFVPLMTMFPDADLPVIPVSVLRSDNPAEHIAMGEALRPFRERGVFFVGSGSSMHHFERFQIRDAGRRFGDALTKVIAGPSLSPADRVAAMKKVQTLDGFDDAQPPRYHEHLMPLLTLLGTAAGHAATEVASVPFYAANVRHYLFEEE